MICHFQIVRLQDKFSFMCTLPFNLLLSNIELLCWSTVVFFTFLKKGNQAIELLTFELRFLLKRINHLSFVCSVFIRLARALVV